MVGQSKYRDPEIEENMEHCAIPKTNKHDIVAS